VEVVLSCVEGKISDKQFIGCFAVRLTVAFQGLFPNVGSKIITEPSSPEDSPRLQKDKLSNRREQDAHFLRIGKEYIQYIYCPANGFDCNSLPI